MITALFVVYFVVTLGALRLAASCYRDDRSIDLRAGRPAPRRITYVLSAVGWPILWAILPIVVLGVGLSSFADRVVYDEGKP